MIRLLLGAALGTLLPLCASAQDFPAPTSQLTIVHSPQPAFATARTDTTKDTTTYVWDFRTDVHNDFDFPVRIVEFGAEEFRAGQWVKASASRFDSDQFAQWYTAADSAPGGWLKPGRTAADANNWYRGYRPIAGRSRWFYVAEAENGQRYVGRNEVVLVPFIPNAAPWSDDLPGTLVPLTLPWGTDGGPLPAGAQIRLARLVDGYQDPWAVYAYDGTTTIRPQVRVPGLYRLRVFVPGYQLAERHLVLPADDTGQSLALQAVPNDRKAASDESPFTPDDKHEWLNDIRQLKLAGDQENVTLVAAYQEHGDEDDFSYDFAAFVSQITPWLAPTHPQPVRQYAAFILLAHTSSLSREQAQTVAELLPAESVLLAADPARAAGSARALDKILGTERRAQMAARNPDRLVRGHATAGQGLRAAAEGDTAGAGRAYLALTNEFADMRELVFARSKLNPANKVQPGRPLPAFSAPLLNGEGSLTQDTATGSYRLLHFWASWCGPCKAEMKHIHEVYERFQPQGLEILSFSLDRTADDARAYQADKWPMPWANAFLAEGTQAPAAKALEVLGIPRLVLVDPAGKILAVDNKLRGDRMAETIAKYLDK